MTKHMYRIDFDPVSSLSVSEANAWIEDWVAANDVWVGDRQKSFVEVRWTDPGVGSGVEYWRVVFRFHPIKDRTELLYELNEVLQANSNWFVAAYHVCEHDDRPSGACSWDHLYYWPDLASIPSAYTSHLQDSVTGLYPDDSTEVPDI